MSEEKEIDIKVTDSDGDVEEISNNDSAENGSDSENKQDKKEPVRQEPEEDLTEEEKLQAKVVELEDRLLRSAAEFDNFRKRTARNYDHMICSANQRVLTGVLDVIDNFDRALQHSNGEADIESMREGMSLIHNQMKDLLAKFDVTPIGAIGKPFDPNLHEAMMQVDSEEYSEGIVAMEIARGYMIGNTVLRHSKVGVSKGVAKDDSGYKK